MKFWMHFAAAVSMTCAATACKRSSENHAAAAEQHRPDEHAVDRTGPTALIELSEEALAQMTLRTAQVVHRPVMDALTLPAEVRTHPDEIAHITPLVSSQVSEVRV